MQTSLHRVSSREDRTPTQHARQLLGQDGTRHGGYVHRCDTFPSHREYCECFYVASMYRPCRLYLYGLLSLSPPQFALGGSPLQINVSSGLVSRWSHANLKHIYIKCWNGDFDVWRLHIKHLHILALGSALHFPRPSYIL